MKHVSPLRYPGGKGSLTGFLTDVIDLNDLRGGRYFEPYAGGAGAALKLLRNGVVSDISINDADPRVFAFWHAALHTTDQFIEAILRVPLTIEEWHKQRAICDNPKGHRRLEVGFSAFFMNRCNRSGVLTGAGPIGGLSQSGAWRLDVRFNREQLAERFHALAKLRSQIHISGIDAVEFLKLKLPRGNSRKTCLVYLDPPYVNKGQRLYLNSYNSKDHAQIAGYINSQRHLPWIMSYDDTELIRKLYAAQQIAYLPINYSLQEKRAALELIIAPSSIYLPRIQRLSTKQLLGSSVGLSI